MRVLLVHPECQSSGIGFRLAAMPEPLALELLAASLGEHTCRIYDMRIETQPLQAVLSEFAPDMVAVTALTPEVYAAHDVVRDTHKFSPDIFTVIGGYHGSLMPEDFYMPEVDAICIGEGELNFPLLVDAVAKGTSLIGIPNLIFRDRDGIFIRTAPSTRDINMDDLPLPRRDLTSACRQDYFFLFDKPDSSIATGRGCPYRCNFCSVWEFYDGKIRQMSPQRVLQEVRAVTTDHITFVDDNFLMNNRRENAIADLILSEGISKRYSMECRTDSIVKHPELVEKWVKAGLYAVLLGLEGTDSMLKSVNKKNSGKINDEAIRILQANGVIIWGAFIVDPAWSADEFAALKEYVDSREITHTQYTVLTPLPGTQLYRQRFSELLTFDYSCYDTLHSVLPTKLPREEFYKQYAALYRQTRLGPYYDLVREGKLTIENCRQGQAMLEAMTHWERYIDKDPVLGKVRPREQALPGALKPGRESASA